MKRNSFAALFAVLAFAGIVAFGEDFTRWVDPFVGTQGEGNCFPGACRPFGMVQPSPDTGVRTWCSGYKFDDTLVRGFSQTHLNGTGRPGMGDVSILPLTAESKGVSAPQGLRFEKSSEVAEPGYYAVTLENGVKVEMTSTARVAWYRLTWPEGARNLYVDPAAMLMQAWNQKLGATVPWSQIELDPCKRRMTGGKKALGWTFYKLFYDIVFSEEWVGVKKLPADPFKSSGESFVFSFQDAAKNAKRSLEVRIALSTVSVQGASLNLKTETEGKTFDTVRQEAKEEWNGYLSRARIVKGTDDQKKNWYTSLYHLFIQPNVQNDVDGKYRGSDDKIHVARRAHYSTFSLWDTFRAAHPLYTILTPELVPGFVDSLVAFGREHGHLPMWTMWQQDGHDMVGIHSVPVIVDAWKKGLADFPECGDLLVLMVQSMMNNDGENPKNCWNAYWENGYIPYCPGAFDKHLPPGQSVSITLELAYDWWCIADFSKRCGNGDAAKKAEKWANCWKNVFDAGTGFARARAPKTAGGAWREPFDPRKARVPGAFWSDYTEATPWVYTWHVFQDPFALADAMGGVEKALAKLDEFFSTLPPEGATRKNSDEGGLKGDGTLRDGQIGQYWHGNEPSHHIAYFYSCLGNRAKTSSLVEKICRVAYRPLPGGLCGNDDCGQMSAWYLFSMMGFYPFNPCGDGYVLGEAQAEEIELHLRNGKKFKVSKKNGKGEVFLNGSPFKEVKIPHEAIMAGGELNFR